MNKKIYFIFIIFIIVFISFSNISYAASYPDLVAKLFKAFEKIQSWFLKLATPAAAVAICTGIFMKKFSFGDEEKIRTGKNIIRSSLFSYAFILVINLILSAIETLLG